jgi:hypothetical protein
MTDHQGTRACAPRHLDSVDAWLGGTWMDDPDYHDGWCEIRPRRDPAPAPQPLAPRPRLAHPVVARYAEAAF